MHNYSVSFFRFFALPIRSLVYLHITSVFLCCSGSPSTEEVVVSNFKYDPLGRIVLDCTLPDSIASSLIFDTGGDGCLILSKEFACEHYSLDSLNWEDKIVKSGWNYNIDYPATLVHDSIYVFIGDKQIWFGEFQLIENKYFDFGEAKGLISIPANDKHAWKINYAESNISVEDAYYPSERDRVFDLEFPPDHHSYPYIKDYALPFIVDGGLYPVRQSFMIDTGSPEAISLHYMKLTDSLNTALSAPTTLSYACLSFPGVEPVRHYAYLAGDINDNVWIDHTELVRDYSIIGEQSMPVLGNNFLKRFNIVIDMRLKKVYMTPIDFIHIEEDMARYGSGASIRTFRDVEGNAVVDYLSPGMFLYGSGLRVGDVILSVDGEKLFSLPGNYFSVLSVGDSVEVRVLRKEEARTFNCVKR